MTMLPMGMGTQMAAAMQPPKKAGMFGAGKGNIGEIISAALLGAMAGRGNNPAAMMGLQMLHQRRRDAADQERAQQDRENQFQDFVRKESWKVANIPNQQQPHYFEDNAGNLMAVGPDGKPRMVHKDPLQYKLVPNGLGGVVPVNIGALMAGQGQQLPQTLSDDDWGGPTPQASGGFPGPY